MIELLLLGTSYILGAFSAGWFIYWDLLRRGRASAARLALLFSFFWPIGLGLHLLLRPRVALTTCPRCIQPVNAVLPNCPVCAAPREPLTEALPAARRWGLGDVAGIAILFLAGELVLGVRLEEHTLFWRALALPLGWHIVAFGVMPLVVVGGLARESLSSLGWTGRRWPAYLAVGLAGAAVLLLVSGGVERLTQWVIGVVTDSETAKAALRTEKLRQAYLLLPKHPLSLPALAFLSLVTVWGPIGEEVFFRGLMYTALRDRWGIGWAIVASSFVFSLLHLARAHVPVFFLVGAGLALLRQGSGSLLPGIVAHIGFNTAIVIGYYVAS